MKIKVSIDLETPRWLTRVVAFAVPVIVIVGATVVVAAAPHNFATPASQPLRSGALNSLNAVTDDAGVQQYSVGATLYCGQTAPEPGNFGGYATALTLCRAACGSHTAHMCTGDELVRSTALGSEPPPSSVGGWYAGGTSTASANIQNDCSGYLGAFSGLNGSSWVNNVPNLQNGPSNNACTTSIPIYCCD